jgi:trimeric autotransporter adhesin
MGRTREAADLVSENNIYVDIANDRVGVGKNNPATKLDVNGTITCTDVNSTSDSRLKKNIKVVENALDIVNQLEGVRFDWKSTNQPSIGVIAQELEKVLPELVATNEEGLKSVNYDGIIGVLIQAIKELSQK